MKNLRKALSLFTVIAILATMLVVPVSVGAEGESSPTQTVTFDGLAKEYDYDGTGEITYELGGEAVATPTDAGTYTVIETIEEAPAPIGYLVIEKAEIEVTGAVAVDRPYNGTKIVEIEGAELDTVIPNLELVNATEGEVASADVGEDKEVTTNFELAGDNADNCEIVQPEGLTVDITKAVINIAPDNMFYTSTSAPAITYVVTDAEGNEIDFVIDDMDRATEKEPGTTKDLPYLAMYDMSKFDADNYTIESITPAYLTRLSSSSASKETAAKNKIAKYRKIEGTIVDRTGGSADDIVVYLCSNEYVIAMSKGADFEFDKVKPGAYQVKYTNGTYTNVQDVIVTPATSSSSSSAIELTLRLNDWNADITYNIEGKKAFPRIAFGDLNNAFPIPVDHTIGIIVEEPDKEISIPSSENEEIQFQLTFTDNGDSFDDNKLEDYVKVVLPFVGSFTSSDLKVYKNVKGTTAKTSIPYVKSTIEEASEATKECFNVDTKAKVITIFLKTVGSTTKDFVTIAIASTESESGGGSSSSDDDDDDDGDYKITVKQTTGGKISPSTCYVDYGDNKTFRITANAGYELVEVAVDGDSIGRVSSYTFKNIKKNHEIKALFKKITSGNTTPPSTTTPSTPTTPTTPSTSARFTDVKTSDWFYNSVNYVAQKGLMNGMTNTTFEPTANITRGMFVTVLYRIAGSPSAGANKFGDVAKGSYYEKAVAWASTNGIVSGMSATEFGPNLNITREQMATMLYRYAEYKEFDMSMDTNVNLKLYDDYSKISSYATNALKWTAGTGLITGQSSSIMAPKNNATRAEAATVFMRLVQNF